MIFDVLMTRMEQNTTKSHGHLQKEKQIQILLSLVYRYPLQGNSLLVQHIRRKGEKPVSSANHRRLPKHSRLLELADQNMQN